MLYVNLIVYIVVSKLQWHLIVCGIIIGLSVSLLFVFISILFFQLTDLTSTSVGLITSPTVRTSGKMVIAYPTPTLQTMV